MQSPVLSSYGNHSGHTDCSSRREGAGRPVLRMDEVKLLGQFADPSPRPQHIGDRAQITQVFQVQIYNARPTASRGRVHVYLTVGLVGYYVMGYQASHRE